MPEGRKGSRTTKPSKHKKPKPTKWEGAEKSEEGNDDEE
jgi:hypothetical protein